MNEEFNNLLRGRVSVDNLRIICIELDFSIEELKALETIEEKINKQINIKTESNIIIK